MSKANVPDGFSILETDRYSASPMINRHIGECIQVVYTATRDEIARNALTDENIIVFALGTQDPLQFPAGNNRLFGKTHFEGQETLLRISSACLHGSLGDTECGCHPDTIEYLKRIGEHGSGVFVHMPQDALGRGLRDKVRDHRLLYGVDENGNSTEPLPMEESLNTIHPDGYDIRKFEILKKVFEDLGLSEIEYVYLGGNEKKVAQIRVETALNIKSIVGLD